MSRNMTRKAGKCVWAYRMKTQEKWVCPGRQEKGVRGIPDENTGEMGMPRKAEKGCEGHTEREKKRNGYAPEGGKRV